MNSTLRSEFKDLSLNEESIKPGLFHLSLNLLYQPDSDTLHDREKLLHIQLKEEHKTVHLILWNLVALINHRLPRSQNEARSILESVRKERTNHLNTLANLEVLYKELHRRTESELCKQEKEAILNRHDHEAMELKAQCVLEQAYSLIIEETTNHEGIANHRLRDSLKILSSEFERSSGDRQEYLGKALRYAEKASSCVLGAMYCDRPDEKRQRKKDGIEKILQGLKMLESIGNKNSIEFNIWRYTLGVAYNRYDYSIFLKEDDEEKLRIDLIAKTIQVFWSTICDMEATDDSALNLYIARSYAYIGHLLLSRGDLAIEKVTDKEPSIFLQSSFRKLIKDPWICFQEALEKGPEDTHVLNRFGKSLRNFANFKTKENNEKIKYLCEAYNYLSKSITKLPHSNWFAYVTRMRTSKDLAAVLDQINDNDFDSLIGRNDNDLAILGRERDSESWLLKARQDGVKCFNSKATEPDLGTLAKICQMLAKYPDVKKYGPQYVKKKEYIHEAIHYLNYALEMGGFINYNIIITLSGCLYEIEEYRPAIEWMKRSMHFAKRSGGSESLTRIVQYILSLYKANVSKGETSGNYLFNEILFWINHGKSKFPDIDDSISYLCKFYADGMFDFIKYLLNRNQSNSESMRTLIPSCLNALKHWHERKWRYKQSIKECENMLENLHSPDISVEQDIESSAQYTAPDILMPFSLDTKIYHFKYKYDFFISHSNVNRDWVNNCLLYQLETKLHDNDTAFKGCISDRDFRIGRSIIDNIIDAVEHSCKIIFVITEDFIESRWCDYEVNQALVAMLDDKKEDCIIPILLEKIPDRRLPKKIRYITYLDLTDTSKQFQEVTKLKRALLE